MLNPAAFDVFASDYDAEFSHTQLGQLLRQRVWDVYAQHFHAGQHLLELTCGTGEDALWLAQRGLTITATDGSPDMLAITRHKAQQARLADRITTHQLTLQSLVSRSEATQSPEAKRPNRQFDGLYANFGGLNTIHDWRSLAEALARLVRPGGKVILVPMGPVCLWEIGWYLLHGQVKKAWRRWGQATAVIGQATIPIWYPSARRLCRDFAPWFKHSHTESLGLWLPPSYLGHFVEKRPSFFHRLNQLEKRTTRLTGGWGDHYITVLERNFSNQ
jgi:ubiquinone/menaquinone biosynthesis C-methylase UbiE